MVRAVHMYADSKNGGQHFSQTIVADGTEKLATSRIWPHKNWRKFEKFSIFIMFLLYYCMH